MSQTPEQIVAWAEAKTDTPSSRPTSKYHKLSVTDIKAIAQLAAEGYTQTDIAKIVGCSQASVSTTLRDLKTDAEATRILLRPLVEESIEDWRRARSVAADRGDHRPARELIEAAHPHLRPQPTGGAGGGGVVINIGMPGQPIALPDITIEQAKPTFRQALSPASEGESQAVSD